MSAHVQHDLNLHEVISLQDLSFFFPNVLLDIELHYALLALSTNFISCSTCKLQNITLDQFADFNQDEFH